MQDESQPPLADNSSDRWTLIRDISVLQVKLIVDGLRDFVLVPISLVAGFMSLAKSGSRTGTEFYELLQLGKKSEHWINLFGAADRIPDPEKDYVNFPDQDIDAIVSRVESFVVDEYNQGGVTKQAKERLDKAISSLHKLASRKRRKQSTGD